MAKYFRKEFNLNEVASDNDDGKGDDDDTNSKNVEVLKKLGEGSRDEGAGGAAAPPYFAKF